EPAYYAARPSIAIARPAAGDKDSAIDLDGRFALHPALGSLKPMWDAGRFAVVHACGSPSSTRSHFDAQDYMESRTPDRKSTRDGWLSRGLAAAPVSSTSPFRAVAMGTRLPRILRGDAGAIAMSGISEFDVKSGPALAGMAGARNGFESMYEH